MKYNYDLHKDRIYSVSLEFDDTKPYIETELSVEEICNGEYGIENNELKHLGVIPKDEKELIEELRNLRESECFPYINRGELWYNRLTENERFELSAWYEAWLNVTDTKNIPQKPKWLI